jgi:hypothetical protein
MADMMQRQRGRDVAVVGAVSGITDGTTDKKLEDVEMDPVKIKKRFDEFLATRTFSHAVYFDAGNSLMNAGLDEENPTSSSSDPIPNPFICIISSDGVLRWAGGAWFPSYEAALEQVIREDPGVQARRKVEEAYIKAKQGK